MGVVRSNGPVVPAAVGIGNAEGKSGINIRLGVAVGLAPVGQTYLVGKNVSRNLRVAVTVDQNKPIQLSVVRIRLTPLLQSLRRC